MGITSAYGYTSFIHLYARMLLDSFMINNTINYLHIKNKK